VQALGIFLRSSCRTVNSITLVSQKKVSWALNILQQQPQMCTDLSEILHTQEDIYFCHRRQFHKNPLSCLRDILILSNWCHVSQLPIRLTSLPFVQSLVTSSLPAGQSCSSPEMEMGQWVMGQMGHHFWMGHMGHGSLPLTHWPMIIKLLRSSLQFFFVLSWH